MRRVLAEFVLLCVRMYSPPLPRFSNSPFGILGQIQPPLSPKK